MKRRSLSPAVYIALLLLPTETYMSDFVGASKAFNGFTFTVSHLIPSSMPDPIGEKTGTDSKEFVEKELTERAPEARRMFQQYVSGKHPFSQFVSAINLSDASGDGSDHFDSVVLEIGEIHLFFKKGTPGSVQRKARADFILSQLSLGGSIPREWDGELKLRRQRNAPDIPFTQSLFAFGIDITSSFAVSVRNWYLEQDTIQKIAAGTVDLVKAEAYIEESPETNQAQANALMRSSARIVDAVLHGRLFPETVYAALGSIDPYYVPKQLEAMMILAPARHFDATVARVRKYAMENPALVPTGSGAWELIRELTAAAR